MGTSFDAKLVNIYRNKKEPFDEIEVNWINKESLTDISDGRDEDYELIRELEIPFTQDGFHRAVEFDSEEINLLVECDYCNTSYQIPWRIRQRRASRYLTYFNGKTGRQSVNKEMIDLYKDHCPSCKNEKKRETSMIRSGYWHPSYNPRHKDIMKKVFIEHNKVPTSRGQRYLAKLLKADLNTPIGYYFADMVLDNKIIIEYDGGGHNYSVLIGAKTQKQFDEEEKIRNEFMFAKGYKILRVISPSEYFPENENKLMGIICSALSDLYLTDAKELHINFDSRVNDPVYGKLKPIKNILESSEWGEDIL